MEFQEARTGLSYGVGNWVHAFCMVQRGMDLVDGEIRFYFESLRAFTTKGTKVHEGSSFLLGLVAARFGAAV